jgi:hypothetical protein
MKTVAEYFASFAKVAIPATAGPAQRHAMQSAFYSGALAMFNLTSDTADEVSDDIAVTRLERLHAELRQHAIDLMEGLPR